MLSSYQEAVCKYVGVGLKATPGIGQPLRNPLRMRWFSHHVKASERQGIAANCWYNTAMASLDFNTNLAPYLLAHLICRIPLQSQAIQSGLRKYLAGASTWSKTKMLVQTCLDSNGDAPTASLSVSILDQVRANHADLESVYLPVLLAWGLVQPWKAEVNTPRVMQKWASRCAATKREDAAVFWDCMSFNGHLLSLAPSIPTRTQVFAQTFEHLLGAARERYAGGIPIRLVEKLVLDLGASSVLAAPAAPEPMQQWSLWTGDVLDALIFSEQMVLSKKIVNSALPGQAKLDAHHKAHSILWVIARESFRPLLPENDMECFDHLPWATPDPERYDIEYMDVEAKEGFASTNRNVTRHYCPLLYPFLELACNDTDWCDKDKIALWVAKFKTPGTLDSIPLPANMQ